MNVELVGKGYWGSKLLKYFNRHPMFDVTKIHGRDSDLKFKDKIVVVSTPIGTHYEIIKTALEQGCDVFTEKPIAQTVEKTRELIELADSKGLMLCVDLTWTFSPRLKKISACFKRPPIPKPDEYDKWRLPPHALSVIDMFNELEDYTIDCDHEDERRSTITIDLEGEKDNLKYAVDYFYNVLTGRCDPNNKLMLKITDIIKA